MYTCTSLVVFSIIFPCTDASSSFSVTTPASNIQQELCPLKDVSGVGSEMANTCCGHCSMDTYCHDTYSCCLDDQRSRVRFACVYPEVITQGANRYWRPEDVTGIIMVSRCNDEILEYSTVPYTVIEFCQNPRLGFDIDKIIPVTDMKFEVRISTTYKNRFCALCSLEPASYDIVPWTLDTRCGKAISFSDPDKDILSIAEEARCNIFFRPAVQAKQQTCFIPTYKISECNVTGLWDIFNTTIEDACYSFFDPFNQTYKNYFCYLCNINSQIPSGEWSCPDPLSNPEELQPSFSYSITLQRLHEIRDQSLLKCDSERQFRDLKMMVCRDLKCDHLSYEENCLPRDKRDTDTCFILFVKLTFGRRQIMYESVFNTDSFLAAIKYSLTDIIGSTQVQGIHLYKNVSLREEKNVVDYVVAGLSMGYHGYLMMRDFESFTYVHGRFCYLGNAEDTMASYRVPLCELRVYDYATTVANDLHVPNLDEMSVDILHSFASEPSHFDGKLCKEEKLRIISKLDFCIHVDLGQDELDIEIINTFLFVRTSTKELVFHQGEYKKHNDTVSLCLDDYLSVYKNIVKVTSAAEKRSDFDIFYVRTIIIMTVLSQVIKTRTDSDDYRFWCEM